ncbi:hypothetical protein Lepto7376_2303 [[Leptolyngbya] sp. PCC 7376]|uniref:hypothetical protein n=1 Tax=[Leptolyngbya] sp. PCC 7376 TaxID=111781 RepID=UPI00029F0262|nr:hypothetical protein [[Leptolyngbya] sp. PCC 7376]AFY38593.1 hypothetical protein Lepto7376_2303 [[Leptolyngbya] sp. PCC 7376]
MALHDSDNDEFYRGYAKIPRKIRRFLLILIPSLVIGYIGLALLLPSIHSEQVNPGRFAGQQTFVGLLMSDPSPHLMVPRPGDVGDQSPYSVYLLSGPGKTSPSAKVMENAGQWVELRGLPVHRNSLTVLATFSAEPIDPPETAPQELEMGISMGQFSLRGEIMDGKCYPGIMKPGRTKTHRSCAIRCISGGVPSVFLSQNEDGLPLYFMLSDLEGKAVNDEVLDLVADPIEITGDVMRYGDAYVLKADPQTYKLL